MQLDAVWRNCRMNDDVHYAPGWRNRRATFARSDPYVNSVPKRRSLYPPPTLLSLSCYCTPRVTVTLHRYCTPPPLLYPHVSVPSHVTIPPSTERLRYCTPYVTVSPTLLYPHVTVPHVNVHPPLLLCPTVTVPPPITNKSLP